MYDMSCTSIQVPCSLRCSAWTVEGMVVAGRFRRAPDQSCSYFVANLHINNVCAKGRLVCIALLLLIGDLCLAAVILTGDFNKAVARETPFGDDERRTIPLEAAFNHANIPWPTLGIALVWGPSGEPNGQKWPDCCMFLLLYDMVLSMLSLRPSGLELPTRPGTLSNGSTSSSRGDRRRMSCASERDVRQATCVGFLFKLCWPHRTVCVTILVWDQRCPPRYIRLHALRKLLHTASG